MKCRVAAVCFAVFVCLASSQQPARNVTHSTSFVVFPADCNANPPMLFGGKLLAEMDRCAGITTRRLLYDSPSARDAVTLAINSVTFHRPAEVKDLVLVSGTVTKVGAKTVTINVVAERELPGRRELLADGQFVFCAYDLAQKKAVPHGLSLPAN